MSVKATASTAKATKALAGHDRAQRQERAVHDAQHLSEDAKKAAVAASVAAERASIGAGSGTTANGTDVLELVKGVRASATEAVEHAKVAMRAESTDDVASAVQAANLAVSAARQAASIAVTASVIAGMQKELAADRAPEEPQISVRERQTGAARRQDPISSAIDHASRYLVTYNGQIIATFAREEDAFLLESELADLDQAKNVSSGKCEVIERKTGSRLGGYLMAGATMVVFLKDGDYERRFGRGGRRHL